jgi:hypothetical protein
MNVYLVEMALLDMAMVLLDCCLDGMTSLSNLNHLTVSGYIVSAEVI